MSTPGKFEGEPPYVRDFWERGLLGCHKELDDGTLIFVITEEDHERHPELPVGARLYLVESLDGFVHSLLLGSRPA